MTAAFAGRTVAVSGAAIGFGRAIAQRFRSEGARVFGCDVRAPELAELAAQGVETQMVDLTDRAAAARWIGAIEDLTGGAVDVLVNNAGGVAGQAGQALETVSDEDWDRVIAVNLGATMALSRAAVSGMKAQARGAIVNIASGAALRASLTGVQAYCAAKHAVLGLTRQLAHELGPFNIRVNAVAPGFVQTNEATERQWRAWSPERQQALVEGVALRRLGTPDDIADAVLFLASDQAGFITGEILSVNGGH